MSEHADQPQASSAGESGTPPAAAPATGEGFPISVVILTKNEEINIGACLDTLSFSDDIVL